ncbi:MAG: GGDEF domain-containing protein [Maritimibacter sp.]|nr:GGDEF domain-containing protein [Maritimibacter sp.]
MAHTICLDAARLDVLMPMHALVSWDGTVLHAGPTLRKVHPGQDLVGRPFFGLFEQRRPGETVDIRTFCQRAGTKLSLRLHDPDRTPVTGSAICLADDGGVLVNLSFGIAVVDAVARFGLAGSDFAATDLTLELLYLVEANAAAMEEASKTGARLAGAKDAAQAEALTDPLTGLDNRRGLELALNRLIARGTTFSLMHIDLDFFKAVNDTHGHAAGDLVLRHVAASLRDITRGSDVVARVGGDEFIAVFVRAADEKQLATLAGRLIARIEEPVPIGDGEARISASVGVTATDLYRAPELERMISDADAASYESKRRGRACFTLVHREAQRADRSDTTEAADMPGPGRAPQSADR